MDSWYIFSLLSVICVTGASFCFLRLQKSYSIAVYLFYIWGATGLLLTPVLFLRYKNISLTVDDILILTFAGIASWLGNYAYNQAFSVETNIGYVEAVSSVRIPVVYVISLFFFGAFFEVAKFLAIFLMLFGIYLVNRSPSSREDPTDKVWVLWAFVSGLMFAFLIISNRFLSDRGIDALTAVPIWILIASVCYGLNGIFQNRNFRIDHDRKIIVLAILFTIVGQLALFTAYNTAPNLAYPAAISNSRMVLMYMISVLFITKQYNFYRSLGVMMATIGVIMLS